MCRHPLFRLKHYSFFLSILLFLFRLGWAAEAPFVTAHLMGQLGNQFFILAAAHSLAWEYGVDPIFPDLASSSNEPLFNIPLNREKLFFHLNASSLPREAGYIYREPDFCFQPIDYHPNMVLYGWFQSEKYFRKYKEKIIDLFAPPAQIEAYLNTQYAELLAYPKTVSVHMRTYQVEPTSEQREAYISYGREYIERAMALFPDDSLFVIFSNKMEWAKEELKGIDKNLYFVEGEPHYHDLYLMSKCKDQIICNSSFSWWAAYLNKNPDKRVIVPPQWFSPSYIRDTRDLIPPEWIILNLP